MFGDFPISFRDLTPEAQNRYLEAQQIKDIDELNKGDDDPIAWAVICEDDGLDPDEEIDDEFNEDEDIEGT